MITEEEKPGLQMLMWWGIILPWGFVACICLIGLCVLFYLKYIGW